jgi:hypothetical protein
MTETGSDFTLTETGSLSSNDTGSGNTIEGTYTTKPHKYGKPESRTRAL